MGAFLCEDMTVSAGEDDRESGKPTTDFAAQRDPIHARHHHIAEDQVNLPRLFLKQLQRRLGVTREHRVVPEVFEELNGEFAYLGIILHHQNVPIPANVKSGVLVWLSRRHWFRRTRKEKGESGSAALSAVDRYFAAGLLHETGRPATGQARYRARPPSW
jgi:hypothetical protein